ncbi:tyrosine-type recombinase/integrase [Desulfatirhabdium butyrativorans]|uniref:tyrosine-type recombinase/integrase n=1 Tax=Desulfatirhabdium butyrativorans TaxID=340467 RepID=UPI00048585F6|nr:site-specific integrase [Desulfatirhabdium butyrativorans]
MAQKRIKTKVQGVRYREHATRKHGLQLDRYYFIRYRVNGTYKEEGLGWASEGWTVAKAADTLAELKRNARTGEGEITLAEKRAKAEALKQAELDRLRAEQEAAEIAKKRNITFQTFFENEYLPIQTTHKGRDTWIKECQHGKNWIFPIIGNVPLKDVSSFHIERIKKALLDAGRTPRTIQYCFATIRQTWNHARRIGIVSGDCPTRNVKIPKFDNKRQRYLSPVECDKLLEALGKRSDVTYRMALLSLDAGLRFSEIAGLQWQNVDLVRETLALMDTKSGRNRTVYMTDRVKAMLAGMPKAAPDALVFPDQNGNRIKHISKTFDEVVADLGLNHGIDDDRLKCVFHSLRHTHASRLLESGADIYRVKELLGHANVTTTERYSHVTADRLRSAIKNMERINNSGKVIPMIGWAG